MIVVSGAIALQFSWRGMAWLGPAVAWLGPFVFLAAAWVLLAAIGSALRARDEVGNGPIANGPALFGAIVARSAFPIALLAAVVIALAGLPLRWTERSAAMSVSSKGLLFLNRSRTLAAPVRDAPWQRIALIHSARSNIKAGIQSRACALHDSARL